MRYSHNTSTTTAVPAHQIINTMIAAVHREMPYTDAYDLKRLRSLPADVFNEVPDLIAKRKPAEVPEHRAEPAENR